MDVEYEGMRRKKIRRHNQTVTEFYYDRGGRMIEIKHSSKDGLLMHSQYLYDAMGNVRQQNVASSELNRITNFQYDSLYRISRISNFEVDSISHLESLYPFTDPIPDLIPDSQSEINSFIRNDLQLKRKYTYDLVGNRLTKEDENQQLEQYIMNNDLDQYSKIKIFQNDNEMEYDMMGNLIEDKKNGN